jgi:G3E family GTPase
MARVPAEPRKTASPSAGPAAVPLTVIAGYHGAGKTTVLDHILRNSPTERIAVLVNDFDCVRVDSSLVRARSPDGLTLRNGCLCRRCRGSAAEALIELRRRHRKVEHVLIEAGGLAAPKDIAEYGRIPGYRLDGVIVVTDAEAIRSQVQDPAVGLDVIAQLLAGDLVVLNKSDLVSRHELEAVTDWVRELIPTTRIVEASYGRLPPALMLERHPSYDRSLERRPGGSSRVIERHPHEVGYSSWSWADSEPINDAGFRWWAATLPEGVIRGRGVLHLRSDPASRFVFDLIGTHWTVRREGPWYDQSPSSAIALLGRAGSFRPGWLEMTIRRCTTSSGSAPARRFP